MSFSLVINFFSYLLLTWETCVLSCFSCVWLFMTLWTVAHQAPLFMGFSRQEYWSELPFPSPGHLMDPGIKPMPPALAGGFLTAAPPRKPQGANHKPQCSLHCRFVPSWCSTLEEKMHELLHSETWIIIPALQLSSYEEFASLFIFM